MLSGTRKTRLLVLSGVFGHKFSKLPRLEGPGFGRSLALPSQASFNASVSNVTSTNSCHFQQNLQKISRSSNDEP